MPRSTREWAHRKLKESKNNLDWSLKHLEDVRVVYEKEHPEIGKGIDNLQAVNLLLQDGITELLKSF